MNHVTPRSATYAAEPHESWLWSGARSITLSDVTLILRRRLWLLAVPIILVLLPALWVIAGLTPYYTAQTTLVVRTPEVQPGVPGVRVDQMMVDMQTDLEIITSERLALKAIEAARLAERAEFNPLVDPKEPLVTLPNWRELAASLGLAELLGIDAKVGEAAGPVDIVQAEVLPRFQKRLVVTPMGDSRVIQIQFTAESPSVAAQVANTLAELYITHQMEGKMDAQRVATSWLTERISGLRGTVEEQERKVESFRAKAGILEGRTSTLVAEQISTVGTDLIAARAAYATAAARQRELQSAMGQNGPRSVLERLGSANSAALLERELASSQTLGDLQGRYGSSHPQVVAARNEAAGLQAKVRAEATNAVAAAQSEAAVAQQHVQSLEQALGKLETELSRIKTAEVEMRGLERDAEANRALLNDFMQQLNSQERIAVERPDAWTLSPAVVPAMQSGPNKKLMGVGVVIVCGALWILMVVGAELLEGGIRSTDEVKQRLGATPLGLVPRMPSLFAGRPALARYAIDKPMSAYAEALRGIYTALLIEQQRGGGGKAVMVTSSVPMEGKSMLVTSLGRQIAKSGQKVLIIDADLRRPNQKNLLGGRTLREPSTPLPPDNPVTPLVQEDGLTGAHVITADRLSELLTDMGQAAYILHPNTLTSILAGVRHLYDIVLVDTPPVAPVADARALALAADHCLFVVRWGRTSPRVARYALDQLRDTGARVTGVVVTQVEAKKHALYGYGDSAVSAKSAYRYYTS